MGVTFNDTTDTVAERTETTNPEGGQAFVADTPEYALYRVTINNLLEDTYYRSAEDGLQAVEEKFGHVAESNPEFVLKLAKYARQEMYLRQVPQFLFALAADHDNTKEYLRDYACGVMSRADEPLETLAMYFRDKDTRTLPNALSKSVEDAMHQWDLYQYSKWDRPSREWRWRDVMPLVHPKPRDETRDEIFERIVKGDLDDYPDVDSLTQHGTWEDSLSDAGEEDVDKAEAYRRRLDRMPLKATIMQSRDMIQAGLDPEEFLTEERLRQVPDSKLWPFRFHTAYRALKEAGVDTRHTDEWFERAVDMSVNNTPDELRDTYVGVDLSGSMHTPLSDKSTVDLVELGALFGGICAHKGSSVSGFGSNFHEFKFHSNTPVLEMQEKIAGADVGHATNGHLVIEHLYNRDIMPENVVLFTDEQLWNTGRGRTSSLKEAWDKYVERVHPDAKLYVINLNSYKTSAMPEGYHNVYPISGWTENVIKHIKYADDERAAVNAVERVQPD